MPDLIPIEICSGYRSVVELSMRWFWRTNVNVKSRSSMLKHPSVSPIASLRFNLSIYNKQYEAAWKRGGNLWDRYCASNILLTVILSIKIYQITLGDLLLGVYKNLKYINSKCNLCVDKFNMLCVTVCLPNQYIYFLHSLMNDFIILEMAPRIGFLGFFRDWTTHPETMVLSWWWWY